MGNILNLDGIDNYLISDIEASYNALSVVGKVSIIADANETQQLLAELSEAAVNLFDGYTSFQNILKSNGFYFFHLKKQKRILGTKRIIVSNEYEFSSILFKKLSRDYSKISIEPYKTDAPFIEKLLSHIFRSDEVFITGHDIFNAKYKVHASDKNEADILLSDAILDNIGGQDDISLSIVHDKLIILQPGISKSITETLLMIMAKLSV